MGKSWGGKRVANEFEQSHHCAYMPVSELVVNRSRSFVEIYGRDCDEWVHKPRCVKRSTGAVHGGVSI